MNGMDVVKNCPPNGLSARTLSLNFIIDTENNGLKESYNLSRGLFTRVLGFILFHFFISTFNSIIPLIGSNGITPLKTTLSSLMIKPYIFNDFIYYIRRMPFLFMILPVTDFFLKFIPFIGMIASSVLILTGISNYSLSALIFILLHTCVFSMNTIKFNISHMMILEATFLTIFLHNISGFNKNLGKNKTPRAIQWAFRLFVYKILIGSGIGQLKSSKDWSKLSAMHNLINSIATPTSFSWIIERFSSDVSNEKVLTMSVLIIECILSVFIITPIRSCRLLGVSITTAYSIFFYLLGGDPYLYLLLFGSSLLLLDDKTLQWAYDFDTVDSIETGAKSEDGYQLDISLINVNEMFSKLFYTTPKVDELKITVPILGFKINYNNMALIFLSKLGCRIIYLIQFLLSIVLIVMFFINKIHWTIYVIIPISILVHIFTDFANFLFAYITTFTLYLTVTISLFINLLTSDGSWEEYISFVIFSYLLWSLSKSCDWDVIIKRVLFEIVFFIFLIIGFKEFICNLTSKQPVFNTGLMSFGLYNTISTYNTIQKHRYEVVLFGLDDEVITENSVWKEYGWRCKPGVINDSPCYALPYERPFDIWAKFSEADYDLIFKQAKAQPNWKAPLSADKLDMPQNDLIMKIQVLLQNMVQGNENLTYMFGTNPFPHNPKHMKAIIYSYYMSFKGQGGDHNSQYTEKELNKFLEDAKIHNYDPSLGKYANYGSWWNRQPLVLLAKYDFNSGDNDSQLEYEPLEFNASHKGHNNLGGMVNKPLVHSLHRVSHSPFLRKFHSREPFGVLSSDVTKTTTGEGEATGEFEDTDDEEEEQLPDNTSATTGEEATGEGEATGEFEDTDDEEEEQLPDNTSATTGELADMDNESKTGNPGPEILNLPDRKVKAQAQTWQKSIKQFSPNNKQKRMLISK